VLVCPGCHASQAVSITANVRLEATQRWRGQCLDCAHSWDFDDE
jgi:RNase P subunit RPR2